VRAPGPEKLGEIVSAELMTAEQRDNPLAKYFLRNQARLLYKWHHYFEIYHRHFQRFRGKSPVVLEIGVFHGGSLQMWHEYFGPGTRIVGMDIDSRCSQFANEATTIIIGDQGDPAFLADVRRRFPHIDIIIDDGGHRMEQQITSFGELYAHLQPNGVYLCEDVHTSYMGSWGGGLRREGTFIEFSKHLVDALHGWYYLPKDRELDVHTAGTFGVSFYDSIVVVEKRPLPPPRVSQTGKPSY
jgi:23S rRNA U2552 (ribose-2'-O)-methylase RlmE/FtsJ